MIIIKTGWRGFCPPHLSGMIYPPPSLTVRQVEVLRLTAQGMAAKVIARQLNITDRTVAFHKDAARNLLGIPNSRAFGLWAAIEGLFSREELEQFTQDCIERAKHHALGLPLVGEG